MLSDFLRRVKMLAGRRRFNRELREEIELHATLRGDGRKFGNDLRLRELSQDAWGWRWLADIGQDVRHGLRLLARTPTLTCVALLSLGLGIGANTALFSLTDALLLRTLPVAHPEELMELGIQGPRSARMSPVFNDPLWEQVRQHEDVFDGVFAWSGTQFNLSRGGEIELVNAVQGSGEYFSTLGVQAEAGRLFGPGDDHPACPAIADISDGFWHSRFGGSDAAMGATLNLSGHLFQVIGVMPPGFFGVEVGQRPDIVVPLCTEALTAPRALLGDFFGWWLNIVGRVRPGVSESAASARIAAMGPGWMAAALPGNFPSDRRSGYMAERWMVVPAAQGSSRLRTLYGSPLEALLVIAGLVLLVACANLAGLLLARATARRQEIGVRLSLGASRARLIRQLLTESMLLAVGGVIVGVGFAYWATSGVQRFLSADLNLSLDSRVLMFTVALTAVTGLLVGIVPALRATDVQLASQARPGAAVKASGRHGLGSRSLVAGQIAVSLVLLAGAGLFLRSFRSLTAVRLGMNPDHLLLIKVSPPSNRPSDTATLAANTQALDELRRLPGVESASESFVVPTSGLQWDNAVHVAQGAAPAAGVPDAYFNAVSPGYFATMETALLRGRDFRESDASGAPLVAIVNATLARQLFPRGDAIGHWIEAGDEADEPANRPPPTQIVAVADDAAYKTVRESVPPTVYYPITQIAHQFPTTAFELRSMLPEAVLESEVKGAFARFAPRTAFQLQTMEAQVSAGIRPERMLAMVSALFGGLALLLTGIGLYGVMTYLANGRRKEFGVRLALGAEPQSIQGLVMREAAAIMGAGTAMGALATWILARELRAKVDGLLFGLSATDMSTLALAAAALALVALVAAAWPAQRAARTDPMASLREE